MFRSILSVTAADWPEYNAYCRRYGVTVLRSCPDRFLPPGGSVRVDGYVLTVERDVAIPEGSDGRTLLEETAIWFFRGFVAPSEVREVLHQFPGSEDRSYQLWVLRTRGLITDHELATTMLLDALKGPVRLSA